MLRQLQSPTAAAAATATRIESGETHKRYRLVGTPIRATFPSVRSGTFFPPFSSRLIVAVVVVVVLVVVSVDAISNK